MRSDKAGSSDGGIEASRDHMRRLAVTLALTATVCLAEIVGAAVTGSLALLVDAGHMVTDISVLAASLATAALSRRRPDGVRTWGWARLEVLTAAGGAMVLLALGIYALCEAIARLCGAQPDAVRDIRLLLAFGVLGLCANVGSMLVLVARRTDDMNMRAAFLEVANDALGSLSVIASAVVAMLTGWRGFDAVAGGFIALLMIPRAMMLLRDAVRVLLEETPSGLDLDAVRVRMLAVPHVLAVHDLHANTVSTGMPVVTAHVVVDPDVTMDEAAVILARLQDCLREDFPVSVPHATFQLEPQGYEAAAHEHPHA